MEERDAFGKYTVAISGLAGRYPESENIDEFWSNLMSGTEMCVADDRRWPIGYCKLPEKSGKIPHIEKFDGDFFNYTSRESDLIDAQFRVLHEVAFEAFLDSGNDPSRFANKKTSVFTGWCYSDCESSQMEKAENIPLDFMQNCASRLALNFGIKGPISSYDTACASSFTAFHEAVNAMRNGICETALVCGVTICLRPYVAGCFQSLQMIGKDGRCKCLDVSASGYVRSEAVVAILLERKPAAKRIYAQVLNTKTNTDGYKDVGITFPSADSMLRLMTATFDEVGIDPVNIKYIEGHVTGTQAGDPVECEAITKVFCPDYRPEPLLIGCMKSNMGHSEGSSGVCSVSKSALIFQRKMIPPNINFVTPNPNIEGLINGKLKPVLEPTPFNEDTIALNSFGFGGANVHTIIRTNPVKESPSDHVITGGVNGQLPRLIVYKCRTQEGFETLIQTIQTSPHKVTKGFLDILNNVSKINPKYDLPFRSFVILNADKKIVKAKCERKNELLPQEILLAVNLNESVNIPQDLLIMDTFKSSVDNSLDLVNRSLDWLLDEKDDSAGDRMLKSVIYHSALIHLIKSFGLSVKIIATPKQDPGLMSLLGLLARDKISTACLVSFFDRVQAILRGLRPSVVSVSADSCCPKGANGRTVCKSGGTSCCGNKKHQEPNATNAASGGQVKAVFDSNANLDMMATFFSYLDNQSESEKNVTHGKQMNSKMETITRDDANANDGEALVNLGNMDNAKSGSNVVIQTSAVNGYNFKEGANVMKINQNTNCTDMLALLGSLYVQGNDSINISHLYPHVSYPVPVETASVSPLIKWDHSVDRLIYRVPEYMNWRLKNKPFDIGLSELFTWAAGHVIDDRILFPAAGYLWLIWQSLAIEEILQNLDAYKEKGVEFRDVKLHRATIVPKTGSVRVTTCIDNNTGWFEISDTTDTIICSGYANLTNDPCPQVTDADIGLQSEDDPQDMICGKDFYKELRVRGYEYKNSFQGVTESRQDGSGGYVNFLEHWVCFCDSAFQLSLLSSKSRELLLPTGFDYLKCDIRTLMKYKEEKEKEITDRNEKNAEEKRIADEEKRMEEEERNRGQGTWDTPVEETRVKTLSERIKEQEEMIKEKVKYKVNVNKITQEVSTIGLYVKGIKSSPAPRKKQNAMLRSISFAPFDQEFEEDVNTRQMKEKYMNECRDVLFATAPTPNGTIPNGKVPNGKVPNGNVPNCSVPTVTETKDEPKKEAEEEENDPARGLLNKLTELNKKSLPLKDTIDCLKESANEMSSDLLLKLPTDHMALEHLLYIVADNFYEKELDILEINLSSKSSVVAEIKSTLNNLRLKCKYSLAEEEKPATSDQIDSFTTIDQVMKNKTLNANLAIIQHPSMAFSFLQESKPEDTDEPTFNKLIKSTFNQLEPNAFIMSVFRTDTSQLEKDVFKPVDRISKGEISKMVISTGFVPISTKQVGNFCMILARKPCLETDNIAVLDTETFNHEWVDTLKEVMFNKDEKKDKIWVKGQDFDTNGLIGFMHCLKKEDPRVRGILLMNQTPLTATPGSFRNFQPNQLMDHVMKSDLLLTVYKDNKLGTYLSRPLTNEMIVQESNQGFLDVESKGDLSSLKYYTWSEDTMVNPSSDTYCSIHYSALNFKDVMVASGRVPLVAYPESFRNQENGNLGMEFSGKTKNGTKIMGFVATNAIATGIDVKNSGSFLWEVPETMSLEEAATIPVVYSTVYYALVMRGKLRPRESILIHAGSGGVGQAAINVCLSMGCEVYTTVGSQEKRDFIKKNFGLGEDHIFNSRSISFADDLLRATNGRGVDVVLNSLADEKLLAGISCLADSGRFVEIGKYDLISDHLLDPKSLAMNQTFEAVCLAYFMEKVSQSKNDPEMAILRDLMDQGLKRGIVKPLARHVFKKEQAEEAFRMMATGKHTGKVLLKMVDDGTSSPQASTSPMAASLTSNQRQRPMVTTKKITFHAEKSYIVIGGLGGFGLEICFWLVKKGARKLFITSRTGMKTPYHKFCIDRLESMGAKVWILKNDVSNLPQAADLIDRAIKIGPVGGIFNTAMVLKDAFFENQTKESFEEACAIKIKGTDNLDQITRVKCPRLDHFVCFSSLVASKGNLGQTNYAFANSSMDLICEKRKRNNLPGISIQWGVIGDVGHVAEFMGNETVIAGSVPQRIISCLDVLEKVMASSCSIIGSAVEVTENMSLGSSEDFLGAILNVLGLKDASSVDPNSTLGDLGLDSLMAVEIKQLLEKNHDIVLSTKEIRELKISDIKEISKSKKESKATPESQNEPSQGAASDIPDIEKIGC